MGFGYGYKNLFRYQNSGFHRFKKKVFLLYHVYLHNLSFDLVQLAWLIVWMISQNFN